MKTEDTEYKMVTFEYLNVERRVLLHRDVRFEQILVALKSEFGLPASASLLLFNIVGNYSVCGSTAGILWGLNDTKVPKYRTLVRGETAEVYMLDESYLLFPMFEYSRFRILNRFR
ncbi:unnamed protein product [Rotaria sp. Silwood2]|nr:unnamed protein product [Rotaria sp. Silwood2]